MITVLPHPLERDPAVRRVASRVAARYGFAVHELGQKAFGRPWLRRALNALAYGLRHEVGLRTDEIARLTGHRPNTVATMISEHAITLHLPWPDLDDGEPWPELLDAAATPCGRAKVILTAVAKRYGVGRATLICHTRDRRSCEARFAAVWWLLRLTALSTPQIGRLLGGRDHTTVLAAERAHMRRTGLPRARAPEERCAA